MITVVASLIGVAIGGMPDFRGYAMQEINPENEIITASDSSETDKIESPADTNATYNGSLLDSLKQKIYYNPYQNINTKDSVENNISADTLSELGQGTNTSLVDSITQPTADNNYPASRGTKKSKIDTTSKPFLDAPIYGKSNDSLVYDVMLKNIYVYKNADMKYQDIQLTGDFIRMNTETKMVHANGIEQDTVSKKLSRPIFTQGGSRYELDSMDYNMTSGKAKISGVNTEEGEGKIYGGRIKKMKDDVIHMHNGRYTTCDATCPHFYLQMTKGTVIPNKRTVFGPAYMVFEDVPFYILGLPFGFFPQSDKRSSGIIIPDIGEEATKGFYLRDAGYFWAINDYLDFTIKAGIYTLGSWQVSGGSNYAKRYKFLGNIDINYAKDIIGEKGAADYVNTSNMQVRWTHRQDPKASPNSSFAANVNYATSSYNKYNGTLNDYINSQINSSVSYSKSWAGKPFSLGVNASLGQNTRDSTVALNLPSFSFNVQRISPFKRKNPVGKERWYEKISFTYSAQLENRVTVKQDQLFQQEMFDKMQFGVKHSLPISASFNVLKYLNISPSINYNERWYFRKIEKEWDATQEKVVNSDTTNGFFRVYDYGFNLSANTKLYGTYTAGKKRPVIFRHVLTPTISASFAPDFSSPKFGFYKEVQKNKQGDMETYSPYAGSIYGVPGKGRNASLNFSLGNTLEMKVPVKMEDRDTTKKLKILESFNIGSSYNFLADSLNLAPFSLSARTTVVQGLSIQVSATLDPYQINAGGTKINKFMVSKGQLARLTNFGINFGYGFSGGGSGNGSGPAAMNNPTNNNNIAAAGVVADQDGNFFEKSADQASMEMAQQMATQYYDFNIPWSISFNYTFNYSKPGNTKNITNTISINGSSNITDKWAITASAGYDFVLNKLTPGAVTITRDLHCWQMSFTWIPIGFRQSWNFTIQARSSMLADVLKYKKDRSFLDNYYR